MTEKPPPGPADHAEDFGRRYALELDYHAARIMIDLGIPHDRIGVSDHEAGITHATFHPHGRDGGSVSPDGRINLDSGVMNPEQLTGFYGDEAANLWRALPLKSRMEAIIAHEYEEYRAGSHEGALKAAPDTELPISLGARELLRAMERGWER